MTTASQNVTAALLREAKAREDELLTENLVLKAQISALLDANEALLQATHGDTRLLHELLALRSRSITELNEQLRALSARYGELRELYEQLQTHAGEST